MSIETFALVDDLNQEVNILSLGKNIIGRGSVELKGVSYIAISSPNCSVSRIQANIEICPNGDAWICDCNSTNGTFLAVNKTTMTKEGDTIDHLGICLKEKYFYQLSPGCRITFGDVGRIFQRIVIPDEKTSVGAFHRQSLSTSSGDAMTTRERNTIPLEKGQKISRNKSGTDGVAKQDDAPQEVLLGETNAAGAVKKHRVGQASDPSVAAPPGTTGAATGHGHATSITHEETQPRSNLAALTELHLPYLSKEVLLHPSASSDCSSTLSSRRSTSAMETTAHLLPAVEPADGPASSSSSSACMGLTEGEKDEQARRRRRTRLTSEVGAMAEEHHHHPSSSPSLSKTMPASSRDGNAMPPTLRTPNESEAILSTSAPEVKRVRKEETKGIRKRASTTTSPLPLFFACLSGMEASEREEARRSLQKHKGAITDDITKADVLIVHHPAVRTPKCIIAVGRGLPIVALEGFQRFLSALMGEVTPDEEVEGRDGHDRWQALCARHDLLQHTVSVSHGNTEYTSALLQASILQRQRNQPHHKRGEEEKGGRGDSGILEGHTFSLQAIPTKLKQVATEIITGCGGNIFTSKGRRKVVDTDAPTVIPIDGEGGLAALYDGILRGNVEKCVTP